MKGLCEMMTMEARGGWKRNKGLTVGFVEMERMKRIR